MVLQINPGLACLQDRNKPRNLLLRSGKREGAHGSPIKKGETTNQAAKRKLREIHEHPAALQCANQSEKSVLPMMTDESQLRPAILDCHAHAMACKDPKAIQPNRF